MFADDDDIRGVSATYDDLSNVLSAGEVHSPAPSVW